MLLPTMPAPITTACADEGGAVVFTAPSLPPMRLRPAAQTDARAKPARPEVGTASGASRADEHASHGLLELEHVAAHRVLGSVRVAVTDRLEELAMAEHGLLQLSGLVERQVPDAEGEHVVLLEGRLEKRVVGGAVHLAVDPLVQGLPLARVEVGSSLELVEERLQGIAVFVRRALGGEARD